MRVYITSLMISCWTPQHLLRKIVYFLMKRNSFLKLIVNSITFFWFSMRRLISVLMQMKIEEAKAQETEALQSALTDVKLKLKETQETKSAEISRLQSALQDMQLEIEELSKGLEMSNDLSAENEQLKVSPLKSLCVEDNVLRFLHVLSVYFCLMLFLYKELVSSLQNKNDEDVSKLSEEQIKQEVPVIDQTAIIKLEAENQQLKVRLLNLDS